MDYDFIFMLELLITNIEKSFIAELIENPEDEATKNAYIDYLKENGRDRTAEMVEKGFIPGFRKQYIPISTGYMGSGAIGSGQLSSLYIASGAVRSGALLSGGLGNG